MGYNIFKGLCSPESLHRWKDSRPSVIGGPGQLVWVESEQRWVDFYSEVVTNEPVRLPYQPGDMVWFESTQQWVSADLIEPGDYVRFSDSMDDDHGVTLLVFDDYLSDIQR